MKTFGTMMTKCTAALFVQSYIKRRQQNITIAENPPQALDVIKTPRQMMIKLVVIKYIKICFNGLKRTFTAYVGSFVAQHHSAKDFSSFTMRKTSLFLKTHFFATFQSKSIGFA